MAATQVKENTPPAVNEPAEEIYKKFDDKVAVHTAPSGTQYVFPIDLLMDENAFDEMLDELVRVFEGEEPSNNANP
jgi:hypothetical protein